MTLLTILTSSVLGEEAGPSSYGRYITPLEVALLLLTLLLIVGAVFGWRYARRLVRLRPRRCSDCGKWLKRLSEAEEDRYLTRAQRIEEHLESVDYDVWLCDTCDFVVVVPTVRLGARFFEIVEPCPDCEHRTVEVERRIIRPAKEDALGLARLIRRCRVCGYRRKADFEFAPAGILWFSETAYMFRYYEDIYGAESSKRGKGG